jgi:hypothetical protein
MGDMAIAAFTGVAPWVGPEPPNQASDIPMVEDLDDIVPDDTGVGMVLRIPPKMMPDHATAMEHFDFYFREIHIYQPILSRQQLYSQWNKDKTKISPLLLEGLFSCVGYLSGDVDMGERWLSLSERHKKHFDDAPRVSTMQARLLLMKANEFKMRHGFHYRSWSSIASIVQMGRDLKIDDHLDLHMNSLCLSEHEEDCIVLTRLWSVCFVLELMIGGSQGRTNFSTLFEHLDIENKLVFPTMAQEECWVSFNFSHVMRSIKTVRITNANWAKLRKMSAQWASDPMFVENNRNIERWLHELPEHLRLEFKPDDSPPDIRDHFTPNMHMYHYLSVLLQHRPQLELLRPLDVEWARQVGICYEAAKRMCCLQEAVRKEYGLLGLYKMLRGAHFTLYCLITCTMIHSIALFYPETGYFPNAREFTTRHMRILDECTKIQPLVRLREKIKPLIEAMSADITEEFVLSSNFPPRMSEEPDSPATIITAVGDDDLAMRIGPQMEVPVIDEDEYLPRATINPAEVFQPVPRRSSQIVDFAAFYPVQQEQQHHQHFTSPPAPRPDMRRFDKYDFTPQHYMKAMDSLAGMMSPIDVTTKQAEMPPIDSAIAQQADFDFSDFDIDPSLQDHDYFQQQQQPTGVDDTAFEPSGMMSVHMPPADSLSPHQAPNTAEQWQDIFQSVRPKRRLHTESSYGQLPHKRTR